jgi:hypothetical protein
MISALSILDTILKAVCSGKDAFDAGRVWRNNADSSEPRSGGRNIFVHSVGDQMRERYSKHLGLADKGPGAMLPWREHDDPQKEHVTVWIVFPASTKYFD